VPGTTPQEQGGGQNTPTQQQGGQETPESPVVAQETPTAAPLTPVAERRALAQTGIDPELIALFGLLCLGGGVFLFRRALVRG
jgi:LPXTG-motif cell wall-anchored protein